MVTAPSNPPPNTPPIPPPPFLLLYRHIVYIMPKYPAGCNMVGTSSPPPLARGEIGGTQTWISSDYWLRLDVRQGGQQGRR